MSLWSSAARRTMLPLAKVAIVVAVAGMSLMTHLSVRAQTVQTWVAPNVRLPDASYGIDDIARSLVAAFDDVDVVALGEAHGRFRQESDVRIALVRHPAFAKKVRFIVVEFASTTEQGTLDRYMRGEKVLPDELARVWKTTTQAANGVWDSPVYAEFFAAVRDVNLKLPAAERIRVLGGDPGPGDNRSREIAAVAVLKEHVLGRHAKALVIYGAGHFYRTLTKEYVSSVGEDNGITRILEENYPGRILVVIPIGRLDRPRAVSLDVEPDFRKFDDALKKSVRPTLLPLQRLPFRDLRVEEFLGRTITSCRGAGGCVSVFKDSKLTLGQMADACLYFGGDVDVNIKSTAVKNRD